MKADLREVIRYLVYNAKYPPTKTSLIKLVYMSDYYHWQAYGEQLTSCEYRLQRYGAVCFAISDTANEIAGKDLKQTIILYPNAYQIMYERMPESNLQFDLTPEQREILDAVIERHSGQSLPVLKKVHYDTEPMQKAKQRGEKLDMTTIKRIPRVKDNSRIRALQNHISKLDRRTAGSPEERAEHYLAVMSSMALARKRANTVVLQGD